MVLLREYGFIANLVYYNWKSLNIYYSAVTYWCIGRVYDMRNSTIKQVIDIYIARGNLLDWCAYVHVFGGEGRCDRGCTGVMHLSCTLSLGKCT